MENITLSKKKLLLAFFLQFATTIGFSQSQTFNSNNTFVVPAGVTQITVEAWGGGGKGGNQTANGAAGGGGGGAYSRRVLSVNPGEIFDVVVGAGSAGAAAGANSSFGIPSSTVLLLARGGTSATNNSITPGVGGTASFGDVNYNGGNGKAGVNNNHSGGGGSSGGTNSNGANGNNQTGGTATGAGSGGNGRANNGNGANGGSPGGGGGGAYRTSGSRTGGNGGNGLVVVSWTAAEINVTGNGSSIVSGDNTPSATDDTNFGSIDINAGSITRTFTIQNTGNLALSISGVTITGANASDFSVATSPASSVNPGGSTTLVVSFDPSAAGTKNAVITINNSDDDESAYTFSIQGTGIMAPEMDVQGNGNTILDGDSTPWLDDGTHFGNVEISLGVSVKTFTIYNYGAMALSLSSVTIGGTHATNFTTNLGSMLPTSVAPGGSLSFTVTFNPNATGTRNATISIGNNDPDENPYNFSLQGVGTSPEINVQGNLISIAHGDSTPSVSDNTDFGTVSIDAGSTLVTFTIQNTGTGALNIGAITFAGANAADFSLVTPPASSVASGSSTTFVVTFNPVTVGIKTAYLYIVNDDANENPYYFMVTGLGVRTYADTDGDNISDNFDLDDDNDGIPDTVEQAECILSPLAGSVTYTFLNETFGAGVTKGLININIPGATCTYCYEDGVAGPNTTDCPSQSSWILDDGEYVVVHKIAGTTAGDPENIHGDLAWNGLEDHTPGDVYGRMAVFNASFTPGTFYETTITGIIPNVPVTYSFWVLNIMSKHNYAGSILPNITVEFIDPSTSAVLSSYNTGDIGRCNGGIAANTCDYSEWQEYVTTVNLGLVTTFTIRFKNNAPGGGGNDLAIDDIMLTQQYCDRDGDGIADLFDLDSDNDGIPDIEEAGFKHLSSGKATIDTSLATWVDANNNGLVDSIDAMIASGTYSIPDSDGDGVKDFHDLDSDNDSIFDVDESNLFNGDGDINGDGFGDGPDTDKDGILDLFDNSPAFGTNPRPFANDTDGDGIADYREIDANTDGVKDILTTLYGSFDANLDGRIDGSADVDKDGILDSFDTNTAAMGSPRDLNRKLYLDFDGRNDYGQAPQMLGGLAKSTIMCWIKLNAPFTSTGYIIGQDNFSLRVDMTDGTPKLIARAKSGVSATYNAPLSTDRWYHVCAVYDGSSATERLKLYVNGNLEVVDNSGSLAGTLTASTEKFTIGRAATPATSFFKGSIDEVRVFNTALTTDQIQKMVYQEIKQQGIAIRGEVVPKNIESTLWFNLIGYYRMDAYKDDVIDNWIIPGIDNGTANPNYARIYNNKLISYQLAPMPFVTTQSSALEAAVSQNNYVNGNDLFLYDWSILKIKHNINLPYNLTGLGLFIDPNIIVNLTNDNKIQNNWYMRLDGKLDLQGKSQLVQTGTSDLDPVSAGFVEKDQQGQTNKWNYNYWASPVGAINSGTNNNSHTVAGVLKDGTNPTIPQNIQWTSGLNSIATNPITLSSYWIFKFQNVSNAYANWATVGPNGTLTTGEGFTLKGSNALTPTQNYTFVGKPNNGPISLPIAANNLNLCGNPYASALDADAFITDNLSSLTGTLYFWEHFPTNHTHVLADYQGGYATRTLVGGTPPVSPSEVSGLGSSTRTPGRFIPVGQGFFVTANTTGGTIKFNNNQRAFVRETDVNSNSVFRSMSAADHLVQHPPSILNNNEDVALEDTFAKIRIGYNSSNHYHRQVLVGFMEELATSAVDPGYDAIHIDNQPNDMYFLNGTTKLNIRGEGFFNSASVFPIGVKNSAAGTVSFTLDGIENFDENQNIYIHDNTTGIYHNIKYEPFSIELPSGVNDTRFSLRFVPGATTSVQRTHEALESGIFVTYTSANSVINIQNHAKDAAVTSVSLYNMLGQAVGTWSVGEQDQRHIRIWVENLASGTYVAKMKTTKGDLSKKIIVK